MRLVDENGISCGVVSIQQAQSQANQAGLDLVEVSANANPPVCKIMDFGKYKYELSKKNKKSAQNASVTKIKELQLSLKIGEHDLEIKLNHAIDFLKDSCIVKLILKLKGREVFREADIKKLVNVITTKMSPYCKITGDARVIGKKLTIVCHQLTKA